MPDSTPPKSSLKPSTSTVVSVALGAPVALILAWVLNQFAQIEMPGEVQAAFGAIISAVIGYFFSGGKSDDVA